MGVGIVEQMPRCIGARTTHHGAGGAGGRIRNMEDKRKTETIKAQNQYLTIKFILKINYKLYGFYLLLMTTAKTFAKIHLHSPPVNEDE